MNLYLSRIGVNRSMRPNLIFNKTLRTGISFKNNRRFFYRHINPRFIIPRSNVWLQIKEIMPIFHSQRANPLYPLHKQLLFISSYSYPMRRFLWRKPPISNPNRRIFIVLKLHMKSWCCKGQTALGIKFILWVLAMSSNVLIFLIFVFLLHYYQFL